MWVRRLLLSVLMMACLQEVSSQELVFGQPEKLGSQINSDDEELGAILSDDGKTLYFTRAFHANNVGGKYAGTDIWVSKKDEQGNWLPASNAGKPWNNKQSNSVIGINHDHTVVYLLNAYSNKSGISFSKLYSGAWGDPEFIPIPGINRDDFVGFYVSPTFDVILISMKGKDSFGEEDLYVSLKDSFGKWTEPKNLGTTINTKGFEISPFLSHDKKRLFFSSNGHPGFGDADIFYCDRLFDSWETWSVPKNIGGGVNTIGFDAFYTQKDSIYFLVSNSGEENSDILYGNIISTRIKKDFDNEIRYLNEQTIFDLFGFRFDVAISFDQNITELSSDQKLLLSKLAASLNVHRNILLHLEIDKSDTKADFEKNQKRVFSILNYLKYSGLEGSRVTLGSVFNPLKNSEALSQIRMKFY